MPELVERMTRIANTAVHAAQEENRRKGIANVYVLNGKIVWQLPDGMIVTTPPRSFADAQTVPRPDGCRWGLSRSRAYSSGNSIN